VVETGLSTLTPTYLFVLVPWLYRRIRHPYTKPNWLTAVSKRPSYQHANRDHHEGETDD